MWQCLHCRLQADAHGALSYSMFLVEEWTLWGEVSWFACPNWSTLSRIVTHRPTYFAVRQPGVCDYHVCSWTGHISKPSSLPQQLRSYSSWAYSPLLMYFEVRCHKCSSVLCFSLYPLFWWRFCLLYIFRLSAILIFMFIPHHISCCGAFIYTSYLGFSLYQCYLSRFSHWKYLASWFETLSCECFILSLFLLFFCFLRVMCEYFYYDLSRKWASACGW